MSTHICFVSDTIHSYFGSQIESGTGGAERQQYMLATALQQRGYEVSVLTLKYRPAPCEIIDGIAVYAAIPDVRGVLKAPYKALKTMQALRRIDADIYYVRGNDFLCMTTAAYTSVSDSQFLYAVANDANVEPAQLSRLGPLRYPYLWGMRSADTVVAQTDHQQQVLAQEHGICAAQIPNGYDLPSESQLSPHTDRAYVLWVGSMDPDQKHPERFLDLARQLSDISFRMIGPPANDTPDYYHEIERQAESIPNLEFRGFVDPDEIHTQYRDAIALVNTSDYEGFPNVFLEAWRYGTPVVSLYHTLDNVIVEQPVGIHAGSEEALVTAVAQLAEDGAVRKRLGTGGRTYMQNHYSFDSLLASYEELFTALC